MGLTAQQDILAVDGRVIERACMLCTRDLQEAHQFLGICISLLNINPAVNELIVNVLFELLHLKGSFSNLMGHRTSASKRCRVQKITGSHHTAKNTFNG